MFIAVWNFITLYLRSFIKWFLRRTTKLCELQRICYGEPFGAIRAKAAEKSLQLSKHPEIIRLTAYLDKTSDEKTFTDLREEDVVDYAVFTVIRVKKINSNIHEDFLSSFGTCVLQIWGYKQLKVEVEDLRTTLYDSNNENHEDMLFALWDALQPQEALEGRISKQWQHIGFQGDDPKTDFRGMGMLGLENLLYFATQYNGAALHVLAHSLHPKYGYAFAIVGINLSYMAYILLKEDFVKNHIINISKGKKSILKHFHQFYCYLFYEFDRFWIKEKPQDVMEFNRIRDLFEVHVKKLLENPNVALKMNLSVDCI